MEKNFYNDDFENFLKESTENFRMYPSRKVWHSIYNDLHPSRKWPSLAVCLVLITAILFVGVSNNNDINHASQKALKGSILAAGNASLDAEKRRIPQSPVLAYNQAGINQFTSIIAGAPNNVPAPVTNLLTQNIESLYVPFEETEELNTTSERARIASESMNLNITSSSPENDILQSNNSDEIKSIAAAPVKPGDQASASVERVQLLKKDISSLKSIGSFQSDLAWIDDHAFYNKPFVKLKKNRLAIQYYVTPSVGFRKLEQTNEIDLNSSSLIATRVAPQEIEDKVTQKAALNLEAGAMILYSINKRLRVKTGLQMNYTNYIITAYDLDHPVQTAILLNDPETGYPEVQFRSTTLGNNAGTEVAKKLNNNTVQFSVPVGADYKIAGNQRLKWYVGATVQPTLVSSGHTYVLSTDAKHYIEEPSLLRKWNMNGSFETFLSYKTASGIDINVGPQVRYQFFSSYNKQYSISEKLYNMGIRLGMTKSF